MSRAVFDRIVMMTNGPSATIGEIATVGLERPRNRIAVDATAPYVAARHAVIEFLYARHASVREAA